MDLTADIIDTRDIIERIEELESSRDDFPQDDPENFNAWSEANPDDDAELNRLMNIMDELAGCGGDEQWRGDWYPGTLIRDEYFVEHTKTMLDDCGYIPADFPSWIEIDWDATAENVRSDYSSIEIEGVDYWYR